MGLHAYSFLSSGTDLLSTSTTHREDGDFSAFYTFSFGSFYHFFGPRIFDERMARQKGQMETINQSTIQPVHKQSRKNYESYLMRVSALCFYI